MRGQKLFLVHWNLFFKLLNQGQVEILRAPVLLQLHGLPKHPEALMATPNPGDLTAQTRALRSSSIEMSTDQAPRALAGAERCNGTDPCTIGTMLELFRSLSPQQLTPEQQGMLQLVTGTAPSPFEASSSPTSRRS